MIANYVLNVAQTLNGLAWLALTIALTGSIVRLAQRRVRHPFDPIWSVLWFLALHQLGYIGRWVLDYTPNPTHGTDINSLLALRVFSIMLACALLHRRMSIEGWRW